MLAQCRRDQDQMNILVAYSHRFSLGITFSDQVIREAGYISELDIDTPMVLGSINTKDMPS